jgi:hypothetical protein
MHHAPTARSVEICDGRKSMFVGEPIEIIHRVGNEGDASKPGRVGTVCDVHKTVVVSPPHVQRVLVSGESLQPEGRCERFHHVEVGRMEAHECNVSNFYDHWLTSILTVEAGFVWTAKFTPNSHVSEVKVAQTVPLRLVVRWQYVAH